MGNVNLFSSMSGKNPYAANSIKQKQNTDLYKIVPLGTNPSGLNQKKGIESGKDLMKSYLGLD